jgi:hypothetical protein
MTAAVIFAAFMATLLMLAPPLAGPVERGPNRPALQRSAQAVETALGWPGLAPFLDAAAWTESRWHPTAGARRVGTNGAIGGWQTRPTSAFPTQGRRKEWTRAQAIALGDRLLDPRIAAAAIAAYLYRLRGWNQAATWGDLRAAMVFPVFVQGRPTGDAPVTLRDRFPTPEAWAARYDLARANFLDAIEAAGVQLDADAPANFPDAPAPFVSELTREIGAPL